MASYWKKNQHLGHVKNPTERSSQKESKSSHKEERLSHDRNNYSHRGDIESTKGYPFISKATYAELGRKTRVEKFCSICLEPCYQSTEKTRRHFWNHNVCQCGYFAYSYDKMNGHNRGRHEGEPKYMARIDQHHPKARLKLNSSLPRDFPHSIYPRKITAFIKSKEPRTDVRTRSPRRSVFQRLTLATQTRNASPQSDRHWDSNIDSRPANILQAFSSKLLVSPMKISPVRPVVRSTVPAATITASAVVTKPQPQIQTITASETVAKRTILTRYNFSEMDCQPNANTIP